ncbi:hypothetical protein [Arthrobacter sp. 35/47]|uniref:hypothetical protein n=1 Tax=Arthrobacter sp. 35/47 TaxID=269454 RepID=UPI000479EB2F|nr:hypothetical protein [Arthrobacter sp. 35/47]
MGKRSTAVVVIHGMGEQLPMDTLRDFVHTVTRPALPGQSEPILFNKPDRLSDGTDLRRLSLPRRGKRPLTDFFEFYWAPEFKPGRVFGLLTWAHLQIFRPFVRHAVNTRLIVRRVQVLLAAALIVAGLAALPRWVELPVVAISIIWILVAATVIIICLAAFFLWRYGRTFLSDVLRYFAPTPRDVTSRDRIRQRGVSLLKRLHDSEKYSRIIVVGHSLGSVVAYDILRLTWDAFNKPMATEPAAQPVIETFDAAATPLLEAGDLEQFQQLQHRLFKENQTMGVGWKVTDFVSLGSPLTHGVTVLSGKKYSLADKLKEREFPTCPPTADVESGLSHYLDYFEEPSPRDMRIGNAAAVFGPTRWTNLYFPATALLGGDPAGGPLAPVFGRGVRDIPVRLSYSDSAARWLAHVPFLSHTKYWSREKGTYDGLANDRKDKDKATGTREAVPALKSALNL